MGKPSKKNFYAIHKGHQTGVFRSWSDAEPLVKGFAGAKFKGFGTKPEAEYFAKHGWEMPAGDRSAAAATKDVFQVKKSGPMKAAGSSSSSSSGKMNHVPVHVAAAAMASASAAASSQPPHLSPTLIPRNRFDPNTLVVSASPKLPRDADIISHFADATLLPPRPEAQKRAFDQAIEVDGVRRGALDGERQIPFHEYGSQPGWLKVYTDGSCFGNGKGVTVAKAGIGAFFGYGDPRNISEPLSLHTPMDLPSNQKAEIQAVTESLKRVPPDQDVMILTDSQYVIKAMTEWIKNWRRKQFDGVANKEYFFALEDELRKRSAKIQWEYVPGHSGMEGNEKADQLAKAGAERYVRVSAGKGKVKA